MTTFTAVVSRVQTYPRPARRGPAWHWVYETEVDGHRFDNASIVELRRVLRRRFPGITIIEPWKAAR